MPGFNDMQSMMPNMMPDMVTTMMLSRFPKEKHGDLVLKIVPDLVEQAGAEMSEEEKKNFIKKLIEKIKQ